MTIDMVESSVLTRFAPRGSLLRFGIAGSFNSLAFFIVWEVFLITLSGTDVRILWGTAWGLTGVMAHFVHRAYTFDSRKPVKWTFATSIPTYVISLVGSSYTIGVLSEMYPANLRWLSVLNMLAWGFVVWLTMRVLVFQYKDEESRPQTA
ncbi:hypothetical protein [Candidatus Poseidonia alphae]|uniref:hypothetical protein n=1 Tax=Candidatus Poseidonia alphae TaxID=1915863 RepID=UPI0030C7438C